MPTNHMKYFQKRRRSEFNKDKCWKKDYKSMIDRQIGFHSIAVKLDSFKPASTEVIELCVHPPLV